MKLSKQSEYTMEYAKKHLKRVPLDMQIEKYAELKAAAERNNESVNGFIKAAIEDRIAKLSKE